MSRPPSADSILRNMKGQQFEPKTPIANDMFLPNHSGVHHGLKADSIQIDDPSLGPYQFIADSIGHLALKNTVAGAQTQLNLYTEDGDGTDGNFINIAGKGTIADMTNSEKLVIQWGASSSIYTIKTLATGTGTVRPLYLYTGANTSQLVLAIDGKVGIGKAPTTYALEVSGEIQPTTNYRSTDGSAGLTQTFTGAAWAAKTSIVFKNGLLISTSTC